jgi:hypothetical protein
MKLPFFIRIGFLFIPKTLMGGTILLVTVVYATYTFLDIDSRSHSISDTLMNFAFNVVIIGAVYTLVAFLTSRDNKE